MNKNLVYTDNVFSIFTIAALKDTGFYAVVNETMVEKIFWGKGKGCDFLENTCQSIHQYNEYIQLIDKEQCSFDYERIGIPIFQELNKCNIGLSLYKDRFCTNPNSVSDFDQLVQEQESDKLSNYSTQSKCFQSTATKSLSTKQYKDTYRCHQFKCSSDATEITVIFPEINFQVLCGKGQQSIQKEIDPTGQNAQGQITCPQDYERFCNYTPMCPNFCSEKGVCVNGLCICQDGFGGVDCSIECSGVVDNETCVEGPCPQGKFQNPDNTCKSDCPFGSFGRAGKCEPCDNNCSRCKGPSAKQCTKCQFMKLLQENQCVNECDEKRGFSPNFDSGVCEYLLSNICKGNCKICLKSNQNLCVTCKEGFYFNDNNNQCLSECPNGFFENQETQNCEKLSQGCLQQNNSNTCSQCDTTNGFRLTLDNKCTLCQSPCSQCDPNNLSICFACDDDGYYVDNQTRECKAKSSGESEIKCPDGCKKCSQSGECLSSRFLLQAQGDNQITNSYQGLVIFTIGYVLFGLLF
ncbi:leishmanolysin family protein, putative [Ichthyophthirius multifiliis]|uniref:Leishmanolysin family protein, putative n=1 Tax=Ichthyophthirius multifiliis TaxID=5932 RepID=G0QZJ2_ICHMU|nr:leishmanolysin family protein, putative [Ichthyophthirius multifiliis]EGR29364.1 leishmanolysin family protein, putative [Ichthyophthirius multifiliis]|eukprot:XP_004030600.1 leishmanolysin family protein, putative [Ichthyophthirius multifiliis]